MSTAYEVLTVYELLKKHLKNEEDIRTIMNNINQIIESKIRFEKQDLATKQDINNLKSSIRGDIVEMKESIFRMKLGMERGFSENLGWFTVIIIIFFSISITAARLL